MSCTANCILSVSKGKPMEWHDQICGLKRQPWQQNVKWLGRELYKDEKTMVRVWECPRGEKPNQRVRWNEPNLRGFFLTLHTFPPQLVEKINAQSSYHSLHGKTKPSSLWNGDRHLSIETKQHERGRHEGDRYLKTTVRTLWWVPERKRVFQRKYPYYMTS